MFVVHLSFECAPIYKTGGLGDVVGSLPKALKKLHVDSQIMMPGYGFIIKPTFLPNSQIPVIYIESPFFAHKEALKELQNQAPAFAHFCLLAVKKIKENHQAPDIIHCHDWHTALVPFLLKKWQDPFFAKTKTILTIHNVAFQGNFWTKYLHHEDLKEITDLLDPRSKKISFLREGIKTADFVSTVSPNHAKEIMTGKISFGLQKVIKSKKHQFMGILNGIDADVWNPATDTHIYKKYSPNQAINGKIYNKIKLQSELGLFKDENIPIFGFISRLSSQKGIEFLISLLEMAAKKRVEVIILGKGMAKMEKSLREFQSRVRQSWVSVNLAFDERLAHRIYAAADFFLIPSRYEPCGLTQMIAMRYGTIPIATKTGGLMDSISDKRTGFLLDETTEEDFMQKIDEALAVFGNSHKRKEMIERVMGQDFSWDKSAKEYLHLYKEILKIV
ncbi:MAG: Glycogen synthase [Candidatus Gottesmanbacteria bacterium GW2011_GWA1_34_13]|uniref:Glycogen synthase n=1 Tax=Candidatus Gottesmanbacteria bacterium GW2011_GWA1_34_13 TaxID=1618434 RepID=A0A0G0B2G4_9BACT|nr:MAG: Glycogen synthase [Candidatus Gottesmanbacteria bacterium GW2011_GWA1_34_13]